MIPKTNVTAVRPAYNRKPVHRGVSSPSVSIPSSANMSTSVGNPVILFSLLIIPFHWFQKKLDQVETKLFHLVRTILRILTQNG